jgi:hypothetical protein
MRYAARCVIIEGSIARCNPATSWEADARRSFFEFDPEGARTGASK